MKHYLAVAVLLLLGLSSTARADDAEDCAKASVETKLNACTLAIESGRWQGADLAWAYNNRGAAKQVKGDLDGAIADHTRALELDPRYVKAYYNRGRVHYYKGAFAAAGSDLARSQEIKPNVYAARWLYLARTRNGQDGREELKNGTATLKYDTWPGWVAALYLGKSTPAAVLKAAEHNDPKTRNEQLCEAHFYIGEWHLLKGSRAPAVASLRAARDQCPKGFVEYTGAVQELKRLGER